jgi:hypothetical protein
MRRWLVEGPLLDALELLLYLLLLCVGGLLLWAWARAAGRWEAEVVWHVAAGFGLLILLMLGLEHTLRRFRKLRTEWRRTAQRRPPSSTGQEGVVGAHVRRPVSPRRRRAQQNKRPTVSRKSRRKLRPPLSDGKPHDGVGQNEVDEG